MGIHANAYLSFGVDFGEEWPGSEALLEALQECHIDAPVEYLSHCSHADPHHILCVPGTCMMAWQGDARRIDPESLKVSQDDIDTFIDWCKDAGIECGEPSWLMCSDFS